MANSFAFSSVGNLHGKSKWTPAGGPDGGLALVLGSAGAHQHQRQPRRRHRARPAARRWGYRFFSISAMRAPVTALVSPGRRRVGASKTPPRTNFASTCATTSAKPAGWPPPSNRAAAHCQLAFPLCWAEAPQSWNGSRTRMVSSRSGLVESSATGHWINSSMVLTYFTACAGRLLQLRAPRVDCVQPSKV